MQHVSHKTEQTVALISELEEKKKSTSVGWASKLVFSNTRQRSTLKDKIISLMSGN